MMNGNYTKAIICISHLAVLNNAFAVAQAINQSGYDKKSFIGSCELELCLLQCFLVSPGNYFSILNSIDWNYGETKTNTPEIKNKLIALTNLPDTPEVKGAWWKALLNLLQTEKISV